MCESIYVLFFVFSILWPGFIERRALLRLIWEGRPTPTVFSSWTTPGWQKGHKYSTTPSPGKKILHFCALLTSVLVLRWPPTLSIRRWSRLGTESLNCRQPMIDYSWPYHRSSHDYILYPSTQWYIGDICYDRDFKSKVILKTRYYPGGRCARDSVPDRLRWG